MELITSWLNQVQVQYGVNPVIFGILYVVTIPPYLFAMAMVIQSLRKRRRERAWFWGFVLLLTFLPSYGYLALFARNVPWWIYAILAIAVAAIVYLGGRRLRQLFRSEQPES